MKISDHGILAAKFVTYLLVLLVFASAVGLTLGLYSNVKTTSVQKGSSLMQLPQARDETVAVLGATNVNGISVSSVHAQSDGILLVQLMNTSDVIVDFSPGLQLYGLLKNGTVVPISSLDDNFPLSGGPINPAASISGKVKFSQNSPIVSVRLYSDLQRSTFVDYPVL